MIVTQQSIPIQVETDIPCTTVVVGDGEQHKTLATIEHVVRAFAAAGLNRNDVVIGVGGGLVTDVAGFAAASWHRGTPVVHVSTSLVGMVDAAIGGKTGVNLPEGKIWSVHFGNRMRCCATPMHWQHCQSENCDVVMERWPSITF